VNYSKRHDYYVKKTMRYMESLGYTCAKTEKNHKAGTFWIKKDLWGSDIICRGKQGIVFLQVKTGKHQVSKGVKQLTEDDNWPSSVQRVVCYWPPRAKEPIWHEVLDGREDLAA